ncbi:hypothetical protein ACYZUD_14735 [Pseudomonas sp. XS1P51]
MTIQVFFGIEVTAPKASAKIIRMPVPLEFFCLLPCHESFQPLKNGCWRSGFIQITRKGASWIYAMFDSASGLVDPSLGACTID